MKYLKSKKDSIEESILQMWEKAAELAEVELDGRTKEYHNHRSRLERARGKRESAPKVKKEESILQMWEKSAKQNEASGDKEAYQKFFNKTLKKFGINSPADLKSDEEKKKFYDYIDKNWTADHEESVKKENYDVGTPENTKSKLKATPGQSAEEWEEQVETIQKKNSSMREKLAKIWSMEEGDNPFAPQKKKEEKTPKKTMTGAPVTKIKVDPKIDDR